MKTAPVRCVVIKLGGAFFTDKTIAGKVHHDRMSGFCRDLTKVIKERLQPLGISVVLVSGGGSIGHHAAQAYGVPSGLPDCDLVNVFRMSEAMLVMKADMCREFAAQGQKAFALQEVSLAYVQENGDISLNAPVLMHCLQIGLLPVISGGLVFHKSRGVCPLNGDRLVSALTQLPGLAVERAIFLSGENGLLDEKGETVARISLDERAKANALVRNFDTAGVDVTGGMLAKLDSCFEMASRGVEARILSGSSMSVERLGEVLLGRSTDGTVFVPKITSQGVPAAI